jgi:hypothetical protein
MIRLATKASVGAFAVAIGLYGLLLALLAMLEMIAPAWLSFSSWCSDLVHGNLTAPPTAFKVTSIVNGELTFIVCSVFPVMLLGAGVWLCRESFLAWRAKNRLDVRTVEVGHSALRIPHSALGKSVVHSAA